MTLISADDHFALLAVLFCIAGGAFLAEKTRIGAVLTGAVVAILSTIVVANLGIIPHQAPVYDFVFSYFVPILIPLFLFRANLRHMFFEMTRMTMAFLLASLGTVIGVLLAVSVLDLSTLAPAAPIADEMREGAIAGLFASTYIGGSVNYAALGEVTGLRSDSSFFSAATATDNLFSAAVLGFIALMPGWNWLARRFVQRDHSELTAGSEQTGTITSASLTLSLALAITVVAVSDALTAAIGISGLRYAIITAIVLLPATFLPGLMARLHGGFELGVGLAFVFFAAIAAGADLAAMISIAPMLIALVSILMVVHLVVTFGLGSLLKLSLPELITASNAAILGATTAPALAAAKGWQDLVTPGVLVGVLGYALGTFIGTAIFQLW